jgi:integrase
VFYFRYRRPGGGKVERFKLGAFPNLSLAQARAKCDVLRGDVREDRSPQQARQEAIAAPTFKARAEAYLANPNTKLAARTLTEKQRALLIYAKPLHGLPLAKVTKAQLIALFDRVSTQHGPVMANRVNAHLSAFFTWAVKRGEILDTPARLMPRNVERARSRVLTDDELRALWAATADGEGYHRLVRLLLLTGVRRGEAGGMLWSEFDPEEAVWTVPSPRMKRGGAHEVPLSGLALAQLPPRREGMNSVFGKLDGPFSGWSKCKARLDARLAIAPWDLHDLRRTVSTRLHEAGVEPHIVEALLGHVGGHRAGVAGNYNRATYRRQKREALARWADLVAAIVGVTA